MGLIKILHISIIIFIIYGVFSNNYDILLINFALLTSILVHWVLNNDTCALTIIEKMITGNEDKDTFIYSLVSPIYNIDDTELSKIIKMITILIYGMTSLKLGSYQKFWNK